VPARGDEPAHHHDGRDQADLPAVGCDERRSGAAPRSADRSGSPPSRTSGTGYSHTDFIDPGTARLITRERFSPDGARTMG
jgi:hypothetical protein